jgi:importin-5
VIQLIHSAQENIKGDDDAQMGFLHQSWSRIARVMGSDFLPYLPHVMPNLLKAVQLDETLQEDEVALSTPTPTAL